MSYTVSDFRDMALQLLPNGPAWPRESDSRWALLFESLSPELERINNALIQLVEEMSPVSSTLLFDQYELDYGLPDPCITDPQTFGQRQANLIERHVSIGRQDKQFFIDLAARLGYVITIDEFSSSNPGPAGTYNVERDSGNLTQVTPTGDDWNFFWRVNAQAETFLLREYPSGYGEPYQHVTNQLLECVLRHFTHCHRFLIFAYT